MSGLTLVVDRRGSALELAASGLLRVRCGADEAHRVGLNVLRRIVLLGNVDLSSQVLRACLEAGVAVVLLPRRGRGEAINLLPAVAGRADLRHAQHLHYADPDARLALARALVAAKIGQQKLWLDAHGLHPGLERFVAAAQAAADINALMGVEGAASARYWAAWGGLWTPPWTFARRTRRPPRDPVNALLSLSYALALSHVGRLAGLHGLEPALGFLHGPHRGRPALALDLLEPLRPWVDQWVWQLLVMRRALSPQHFVESAAQGCRLGRAGRGVYFAAWHDAEEEWLRAPARAALALLLKALRRRGGG